MTRWIIRETIRDSYFAHLCIHLIAPAVCVVSFEYGVKWEKFFFDFRVRQFKSIAAGSSVCSKSHPE